MPSALDNPFPQRAIAGGGLFGIPQRLSVSRFARLSEPGADSVSTAGGIFGRLSPSPTAGRFVVGLAVPYGEISHVAGRTERGEGKRFRFTLGAFRQSLAEVQAGLRTVNLLREHAAERIIGSTADGSWLSFEETAQGLRLRIDTRPARGQIVAGMVERDRSLKLSAGFRAVDFTRQAMADGTVILDVTRAALEEVSIVRRAGFDQTYMFAL